MTGGKGAGGLIKSEELSSYCHEQSISNRDKSESCEILLPSLLFFNKASSDLLSIPVIFLLPKWSKGCSDVEGTYWTSEKPLLSFPETTIEKLCASRSFTLLSMGERE